jgi:hypothetical protein
MKSGLISLTLTVPGREQSPAQCRKFRQGQLLFFRINQKLDMPFY